MEQQPFVSLDTQLGPWAGYLSAYTTLIKDRGYSPASVQPQVQLITKFCEWLQKGHTEVHALDEIIVERFLRRHQSADSARRGDGAALFRFLHMLREQGATQRQKKSPLSPQEQLTTNFGRYLLEERGLTQAKRVRLGDHRPENLFSVKEFQPYIIPKFGPWTDNAPDNSRLFLRDVSTEEIYALDLELR